MFGGIGVNEYFADLWSLDSNYDWEEINYSIGNEENSDTTSDNASFPNISLFVIIAGSSIGKRKLRK
jgi:hypothetical protein